MVKLFTQQKPYIRGSSKGFTLTELLVALIVASFVLSLALRLIVDQRQLVVQDQARTGINQNLRAAIDLVGTDIKQAGERLTGGTSFPVIQVKNGNGTVGDPNRFDRLVLQRKLLDQSLPVCQSISSGSVTSSTSTIVVSTDTGTGNPPLTSCPFSNGDTDPLPDNLQQLRDARCSKDGISGCNRSVNTASDNCEELGGSDRECLWVYMYNPATNASEFFLYTYEDSLVVGAQTQYRLYRGLSSVTSNNVWANTYSYVTANAPYTNNPTIYVLEEREYSVVPNISDPTTDPVKKDQVLQLVTNRRTATPMRLVNQLNDFQVRALVSGNLSLVNSFNATANSVIPFYTNWQQIQSIEVNLTARNSSHFYTPINSSYLTVSSQFFPRNAASR